MSDNNCKIESYVYLDDLNPELIQVELFYCLDENCNKHFVERLDFVEKYKDNVAKYQGVFKLRGVGLEKLTIRIIPSDKLFRETYREYIKWW